MILSPTTNSTFFHNFICDFCPIRRHLDDWNGEMYGFNGEGSPAELRTGARTDGWICDETGDQCPTCQVAGI